MNTNNNQHQIVLLKDSEWSVIDGEVCRVTDFAPLGSFIDASGKVQSADKTTPYACITFENKKLGNNVKGYITHKIDFENLWAAFKGTTMAQYEEVIIIRNIDHIKQY